MGVQKHSLPSRCQVAYREHEKRYNTIIDTRIPKAPMYMEVQYTLNEMPTVRKIFETSYYKLTNNDCKLLNMDVSLSRRGLMNKMINISPVYNYDMRTYLPDMYK